MKRKKKYAERVLHEVCDELGIQVPPLVESGIVIDPGSKTTGSIMCNVERSYNRGRSTNLGTITDLGRCTVIAEDFAQAADYIKKLSKQVPCVTGYIKRQPRSGYMGVNINLESDGIPGEIQFGTPEWYQAKKVDDVNYMNTRLYFSLLEKLTMGKLTKEEKEMLIEQQDDYAMRCGLGRRLYESLYGSIDFHENVSEIEKTFNYLNHCTARTKKPSSRQHKNNQGSVLNRSFIDSKGKLDKNDLLAAINKVRPDLDKAQESLCGRASVPIRGGRIIKDREL